METGSRETAYRPRLAYRPHLDGLRCVAVYLVVAYHAGPGFFRRGFIGVDIFFVLSGFLVTRILLRDLASRRRVDFRRFYSRRVRRILPAACVVLVVTAITYAAVATPLQMLDVLGGFKAAFLYVANWFFIHQSVDYFAASVDKSPVLQFWSLSIEEQFYLVWPLGLTALFLLTARAGRFRWWLLRFVIGAAAVASAVAALHIATTNPDRAYYGTDTRAYQLLAGALLALTPQLFRLTGGTRRAARWAAGLALAGLVVFSTSLVEMGAITRGVVAVALTAVLIIAVENADGGAVKAVLSLRPVVYLGLLSYGIYLWHWPVVVIATHERHPSRTVLFGLTLVLSTAMAAVSYHVLERPVRSSAWLTRHKAPVIAFGLAVSVIGGLVLAPAILESDGSVSAGAPGAQSKQVQWQIARTERALIPDCLGRPVRECTVVHGHGLRVVLMGDSHARMWTPAFAEIAKRESWTFSIAALNECPWQRGLQYGVSNPQIRDDCRRHQDDWYSRVVPQLKPDVVLLAHQGYDDPRFHPLLGFPGEKFGKTDDPAFERSLIDLSVASVRELERGGTKVAIIEPIELTVHGFDPLSCISSGAPAVKCQYKVRFRPTQLEAAYRALDDHRHIWSLDFDRLVCPRLPVCDPIIRGMIVKRDAAHLTVRYAGSLGPAVAAALRREGVIESP